MDQSETIYNKALAYLKGKYSDNELRPVLSGVDYKSCPISVTKDHGLALLMRQSIVSHPVKKELESYWINNFCKSVNNS